MQRLLPRIQAFFERWIVERLLLRNEIERLYLVMGGHIYFQTLCTATNLGVFRKLSEQGPMTCEELACEIGCPQKGVRILLLGLATLGWVKKSGDRFKVTSFAKRVFAGRDSGTILPVLKWQNEINYRPLQYFQRAVELGRNVGLQVYEGTEPTLYERLVHQPALEKIFQDAMEGISVQANTMLARFIDFGSVRYIVDVGGGNGTNIITLARQYPKLRASVFDSASVCEIAKANIGASGYSDRLGTIVGDCFIDPFPSSADCLMFCHFFTIWSEEQNRALLRKCYDSLPDGGKVIIFNMMQHNSEDGPFSAAMSSPYFLTLATGTGMLYTWREYEQWTYAAGFSKVDMYRLPRDHGVIVGTRSRQSTK